MHDRTRRGGSGYVRYATCHAESPIRSIKGLVLFEVDCRQAAKTRCGDPVTRDTGENKVCNTEPHGLGWPPVR
jgi:hypothetical protein